MIPANELRIGNWVGLTGTDKWYKFGVNMFSIIAQKGEHESISYYAIDAETNILSPIPLIPEILEKCGFRDKTNGWYHIDWFALEEDCRLAINVKSGRCSIFEYDESGMAFTKHPIKYLHQLQNLYFSLTGEELEVNI